jgi:methylmalonyl-CoA/ethylmalonyl-CoA epimerase
VYLDGHSAPEDVCAKEPNTLVGKAESMTLKKPRHRNRISIPRIAKKVQVGFVVKDAKKVAKNFTRLGLGPFIREEYPGIEAIVRGKPAKYRLLAYTANIGPLEIEICQVLEGRPIHREFLETRGEGVHHIGLYVKDFDKEVARWKRHGMRVLQQSRLPPPYPKEGGYAFIDTEKLTGVILELANPPPPELD